MYDGSVEIESGGVASRTERARPRHQGQQASARRAATQGIGGGSAGV